jgi:hypothetical protein
MKIISIVVATVLLLMVSQGLALAQSQSQVPQQYPAVKNLEPFSASTNFMSHAGYLRWVVFQQQGQWLSHDEAVRIVNQQTQ